MGAIVHIWRRRDDDNIKHEHDIKGVIRIGVVLISGNNEDKKVEVVVVQCERAFSCRLWVIIDYRKLSMFMYLAISWQSMWNNLYFEEVNNKFRYLSRVKRGPMQTYGAVYTLRWKDQRCL